MTHTIIYDITVTGGSGTSLITLSGNTVTFADTSILAYAAIYTISVKARFTGSSTWSAPTTGTFTYVNPCVSATITGACWADFSVDLLANHQVFVPAWSDSVTNLVNNGTQICAYTPLSQYVSTATPT